MNLVDIAVIPTAGRGTRMLPATRAVPKGLIPVIDRPATQYVIEEAVRAGVDEVVLVVDPANRPLLEKHFDPAHKLPGLEQVQITMVEQPEPLGLGHAVLCAQSVVGLQPFFCQLADTIVHPEEEVLPKLLATLAQQGGSAVALRELPPDRLTQVGVVAFHGQAENGEGRIAAAVEKPPIDQLTSHYGLVGRYLFQPDIFDYLAEAKPGSTGEIELTDSISKLAQTQTVWGVPFGRDLLDVGSPALLAHATVMLAMDRFGEPFRQQLEGMLS